MNGRRNAVPTNYIAVPVSEQRRARLVDRDAYAADQITARIDVRIEVISALHAGAGFLDALEDGQLFLEIATSPDGAPCIPGSGIKGAIRSIFEVLAGGCDNGCRPDKPCCAACSLFGCLGAQGRLAFDEARAGEPCDFGIAKIPAAYSPSKAKGRRFYGGLPREAPQNTRYGVVAPGSVFVGGILVELATRREVGLVLLSMGLDGTFRPKLGGGKHGGLGSVCFVPTHVDLLDPATRYRGKGHGTTVDDPVQWARELCAAAEKELGREGAANLDKLRKHLGA